MPIERIADWEKRLARHDAFWAREVIDRPPVSIMLPRKNPDFPMPAGKGWASHRERWMDVSYGAEKTLATAMGYEYLGDALPHVFPNLGPEVFSAFFGTRLEYGETTSWSVPNLLDWSEADNIQFLEDNEYWRKLDEMTAAFLEVGKNRFYTGITDLHPGGDAIAAFRDPQELCIDLIEHRDEVVSLLDRVTREYFRIFDILHERLRAAKQPTCAWLGIVSTRKWYVPSNDFSCMVSEDMFNDVFLPGIRSECRRMQASIYHLDGPGALRHLDSLLSIPELNAIQWVYGAGGGRCSDWYEVYRKCQSAGKGIYVHAHVDDVEAFMRAFRPEGVWMRVEGVEGRDQAEQILKRACRWT